MTLIWYIVITISLYNVTYYCEFILVYKQQHLCFEQQEGTIAINIVKSWDETNKDLKEEQFY